MSEPNIQIEISVRITQHGFSSGQIHYGISEILQLPSTDFLGLVAIMKRFHDLAEEIKKAGK